MNHPHMNFRLRQVSKYSRVKGISFSDAFPLETPHYPAAVTTVFVSLTIVFVGGVVCPSKWSMFVLINSSSFS